MAEATWSVMDLEKRGFRNEILRGGAKNMVDKQKVLQILGAIFFFFLNQFEFAYNL